MQGWKTFETWDETYVHAKLNPDIIVLQERVEGDHHEPWTWVRTQGKGRVFYTAYGHDERTWKQPAFQELVANGIMWAVSDDAKARLAKFNLTKTYLYRRRRFPTTKSATRPRSSSSPYPLPNRRN
jgi:type 1 glutamine amidotransferase